MINGSVRDGDGRPVAGARVMFTTSPVPVPDIAALTDAAGRFSLDAPVAGDYELLVVDDVHAPLPVQVTVPGGGATDAAFADVDVVLR